MARHEPDHLNAFLVGGGIAVALALVSVLAGGGSSSSKKSARKAKKQAANGPVNTVRR